MNEVIISSLVSWDCMWSYNIWVIIIVYFWNFYWIIVVNIFNVCNVIVCILSCLYNCISFWCIVYCVISFCSCVSLVICIVLSWIDFIIYMIKYVVCILIRSV